MQNLNLNIAVNNRDLIQDRNLERFNRMVKFICENDRILESKGDRCYKQTHEDYLLFRDYSVWSFWLSDITE